MKDEHYNTHDHKHDKQHLPAKSSPLVNWIKFSSSTIELEMLYIYIYIYISQPRLLHQVEEKKPNNAIHKKY
jgi:hypothetical protein